MKRVEVQKPENKEVFNPSMNYKWEPDDVFEITGHQLASLYHCLNREVNTPEGAPIAFKYEAFQTLMDVFKRGVDQGVIVRLDAEPSPTQLDNSVRSLFDNPKSEQNGEKI